MSSPSTPPSLDTLPRELIGQIAQHLHRSTFLDLARVSRSFTHLANDYRLWTSLCLCLPRHYGEHPQILPIFTGADEDQSWQRGQRTESRLVRYMALRARANQVLCRADEGRWAKVKTIEFEPLLGTLVVMAPILLLASANLRTLNVRSDLHYASYALRETLDTKLLEAPMTFPSLAHVYIDRFANVSPAILAVLCNGAPGLKSVNVTFDRDSMRGRNDEVIVDTPTHRGPTAVRIARIAMTCCQDAVEDAVLEALIGFLSASPKIKRLILPHDGLEVQCAETIIMELAKHPQLQDLYFPLDLPRWREVSYLASNEFLSLRRLVLGCTNDESWTDLLGDVLTIPNLEKLYVDSSSIESASPRTQPGHTPLNVMTVDFAEFIRDHPKLSHINNLHRPVDKGDLKLFTRLDALEKSGNLGFLSSIKNRHDEILHARLSLHLLEVGDVPATSQPSGDIHLEYDGRDGEKRLKSFRGSPHAVWQDFTSYDDLAVPAKVLGWMRKKAGLSKAEWRRRDVVVDDEVWQILEDWHHQARVDLGETEGEEESSEDSEDSSDYGCGADGCWYGHRCHG